MRLRIRRVRVADSSAQASGNATGMDKSVRWFIPGSMEQDIKRRRIVLGALAVVGAIALLVYLGAQEYAEPEEAPAATAAGAAAPSFDPMKLTPSDEITLGLKASPGLVAQYDGLSTVADQKDLVMRVGSAIAGTETVAKAGWKFQFQLLAEPDALNAFALPGGQIFMTTGLLNRLKTEGEVAAVLAHQIAHVLNRDAVMKLAADLGTDGGAGLSGAELEGFLSSQLGSLRFSTAQETAADRLAVKLMGDTGYSPKAMLSLLKTLATAYYAGAQVEYFQTHPNPATRVKDIEAAIAAAYPNGVPESMSE